jgi:hypothetical protein
MTEGRREAVGNYDLRIMIYDLGVVFAWFAYPPFRGPDLVSPLSYPEGFFSAARRLCASCFRLHPVVQNKANLAKAGIGHAKGQRSIGTKAQSRGHVRGTKPIWAKGGKAYGDNGHCGRRWRVGGLGLWVRRGMVCWSSCGLRRALPARMTHNARRAKGAIDGQDHQSTVHGGGAA